MAAKKTIRSEMRLNDQGAPEMWSNLGDILDWLEELPALTDNRIAGAAALEIRQALLDSFDDAEPAQAA